MFDPALYDRNRLRLRRRGRRAGGSRPGAGLAPLFRLAGPGVVVAIAYVDPGNFATNVQAGAALGSRLLWVVLLASAVAVLVQFLAAKSGAVTGRSLPQLCRDTYSRPLTIALWLCAEVVAIATDFVEIVGGAIALQLLFGLPLVTGGVVVGLAGTLVLMLRPGGRGRFQVVVGTLLAFIVGCFVFAVSRVGISPHEVSSGLVPSFGGSTGVLLASGIVGATIMPHAIYVHSALTSERDWVSGRGGTTRLLSRHRTDILVSLSVATAANAALLLIAASTLHVSGADVAISTLADAYDGLKAADPAVGLTFVVALLFAGLAASCVGTYAGDVVMQGFLGRRVPVLLRRTVTLAPAIGLLLTGLEPTRLLILSQVVLSFGLPAALLPLLHLTSRREVMGEHVNSRATTTVAGLGCVAVCGLNFWVLAGLVG